VDRDQPEPVGKLRPLELRKVERPGLAMGGPLGDDHRLLVAHLQPRVLWLVPRTFIARTLIAAACSSRLPAHRGCLLISAACSSRLPAPSYARSSASGLNERASSCLSREYEHISMWALSISPNGASPKSPRPSAPADACGYSEREAGCVAVFICSRRASMASFETRTRRFRAYEKGAHLDALGDANTTPEGAATPAAMNQLIRRSPSRAPR
jgi:hypothetical protein